MSPDSFFSIILKSILISAIFAFIIHSPIRAQEADPLKESEKLILEGRYLEAGRLLDEAGLTGEKAKQAEAITAVIQFAAPDWCPDDFRQLRKYQKIAIPLILKIIQTSPRKDAPAEQRDWINLARMKFIRVMAAMDNRNAVPSLVKALKDKNPEIRYISIQALGRLKDSRAVKPLLEYLLEERLPDYSRGNIEAQAAFEKKARIEAIATVVRIKDPSIVGDLKKNLEKKGSPDRTDAAIILTGYQSLDLMDTYLKLLEDSDLQIQVMSASALKALGRNDGLPVLKTMFTEGGDPVKLRLLDTIGWWQNEEVAKFFIDYLKKESTGKEFGFVPLSNQGKYPDISSLVNPKAILYLEMLQRLIRWEDIVPPLLPAFMDKKADNFRYIASEILGEAGDEKSLDLFRKNLDSDDPKTVYYSLWALGRMKDKKSAGKIGKLLENKEPHISIAAAWALACLGDDRGRKLALENLKNNDYAIASTALDALCRLRKAEDREPLMKFLSGEAAQSDLMTTLRTLGMLGGEDTPDFLRQTAEREKGSLSFYSAESAYRIGGQEVKFNPGEEDRKTSEFYGNDIYSDSDYARYALLYMSLLPEKFGWIREVKFGDITPLYRYGEYGRVEDHSPANPISQSLDESPVNPGELYPGGTVVVDRLEGRRARVSVPDGREGWIFTAGMNLVENTILNTRERMRKDLGFRWKKDLIDILDKDYLDGMKFEVKYSDPQAAGRAVLSAAALDMGLLMAGDYLNSRGQWDKVIEKIDPGKKTVEVTGAPGGKKWKFNFDSLGALKSFIVEKQ